jgi:hypothetical protein
MDDLERDCFIRDLKDEDIIPRRDWLKYIRSHVNSIPGLICFTYWEFLVWVIVVQIIIHLMKQWWGI